ncbi:zinc ribbon domain-containing protein [Lacrimispora sp. NSJ-141]|uniref:Zinc ribbon domain-containing protein n=1 Tax=Lientehia hominis TaxID=2897778 RepID=A0AAP2W9W6_9FIRM|nr:zinc ribbon domain-containing protein [Lientehia hominis]MCD2492402.1 zinc ribbon domain-containing protein [Lientehia hominis]
MAIIQCPECGQNISDKASKCPMCGYPLKADPMEERSDSSTIMGAGTVEKSDIKKKSHKNMMIIGVIVFIVVLVGITAVVLYSRQMSGDNLSISEINLSKWKLIDERENSVSYEGMVTSNESRPFVALIGYYEEPNNTPRLVYMENGKGTIKTYESSEDDPSIKYTAVGYMAGKKIKESDISIEQNDKYYNDWTCDERTSCSVDLVIKMRKKVNGLLFIELKNDMTKDITRNIAVVIVDGVGEYSCYLDDLPLKSRGVEVTVTPQIFCGSKELKEADYTVETPFAVEKEEGKYTTSFSGKEELSFSGYEDGLVIYTSELLDGGRKEDKGELIRTASCLRDGRCTLATYTWEDSDKKILMPSYDINVIGYLKWNNFNK